MRLRGRLDKLESRLRPKSGLVLVGWDAGVPEAVARPLIDVVWARGGPGSGVLVLDPYPGQQPEAHPQLRATWPDGRREVLYPAEASEEATYDQT